MYVVSYMVVCCKRPRRIKIGVLVLGKNFPNPCFGDIFSVFFTKVIMSFYGFSCMGGETQIIATLLFEFLRRSHFRPLPATWLADRLTD